MGAGDRLEVRFRAIADGGEEAFAFRNLIIEADHPVRDLEVAGDYNGNRLVEQADLDLVLLNWGRTGAVPNGWINNLPDAAIDQQELDDVLLNWGTSAGVEAAATVPEPPALEIILVAILAIVAVMRLYSATNAPHE
jgi:hypothetical protein